ncbi:MAG: hypothetical protein ABIT01_06620 [Thermoanaerobaculia bacterium]
MKRFLRSSWLPALLLVVSRCLLAATPEAARPFLSPWIVVTADDVRLQALASLPASAVAGGSGISSNAPGLLLEAGDLRSPALLQAVQLLATHAHRAGRRWGIALELGAVTVPREARSAEAATADTLYPGSGPLLRASKEADLFDLELPLESGDGAARNFVLRKIASEIRGQSPQARIVVTPSSSAAGELFPAGSAELLSEGNIAYADLLGLRLPNGSVTPAQAREAADRLAFGRPLLIRAATVPDIDSLIDVAARFAAIDAPAVAARIAASPEHDVALDRLGRLLAGDFSRDARAATATAADGTGLSVVRVVSGTDLGGVVVVSARGLDGSERRGPLTLELDAPTYASAEILELATGRTKSLDIPRTKEAPRLALSTANGSIALKLTAREKAPEDATLARVGVTAVRGLTVEEILARHQAWRAARDARWTRFTAKNSTSMRFRFADLNNTLDLTLAGSFFYTLGGGYDWVWSEAYFNGVRWKGKKIPELPLLQPEKVSELPLALTFNDAYRYVLHGEDTSNGVPCYVLDFEPRTTTKSDKPLYAGRVFVARADFAAIRTETRQLNLTGEVQSVIEASDFGEVPAPDGGAAMRFPTRTTGQWVMRTFSRTTVLERETRLEDVKLNPADFEEAKLKAYASADVMVRDTEKGVRYLERTKEGDRKVVEDSKSSRIFGLGGVFYDSSTGVLPLLGVYYLDLDFRKKHQQVQVFFGGILLAASFSEPRLFGTKLDIGADVFGIAIRGGDALYVNGEEDKTKRVKQRSFAGNLNIGYPLGGHIKLGATVGLTHRDYGNDEEETSPDFVIPSNHWVTRLQARAIYDVKGWALTGTYTWSKRSTWDAWGLPGNTDYDPGKDEFRTYGLNIAKDFHFPKFQRIRSSVSYFGSNNVDRFSKYTFGFFGGTSLRGFRSGSLRADEAFIGRAAYGFVIGEAFRIEAIYEHALVTDNAAGFKRTSFGGAGLSAQLPGPWSTIVNLDGGMPVVGRNRGQTGFVLNLVFLKIF